MRKTDTDSLALDDATFAQQLEAIIDADFPATTKLILLKIRLRCDRCWSAPIRATPR